MEIKDSSRRNFIKNAGLLGGASLLAGSGVSAQSAPTVLASRTKAKNLIFLVADGMGTGTLSLAHFWQLRHQPKPLNWMQLYDRLDVVTSFQDTASASSPVTDSAAAGSAWGCGQRIQNGAINMDADGNSLTPLYTHAAKAGKTTGLVTTCRVTHATPAAFSVSVAKRNEEDAIADQYLGLGVDVILGGGMPHFKNDKRDLLPDFQKKGYRVCQNKKELARAAKKRGKVLGLFSESHIPYAIDRENNPNLSEIPGLEAMFRSSLDLLGRSENGFVLQVEGGRVDHAGHVNDPAAILREQLEFDRCIAVALDFLEKNKDTLLIVTTDHGTGGCQLNGYGKSYNETGEALDRINAFTASFEALDQHYTALGRFDPAHFQRYTGIEPSVEQIAAINDALGREVEYLSSFMTRTFEAELFENSAVGWTSNKHTSEHVELLAMGPGAEQLKPRIDNFELNGIMRSALGI